MHQEHIGISAGPSLFEQNYLKKAHRFFLWGMLAHIPFCVGLGMYFGTLSAIEITCLALICAGPIASYFAWPSSRMTSIIFAVASMSMSGLIIHLSRGMIEMHFHIFTVLAILIVFGSPVTILAAAGTIAIHHLAFFFFLPKSVFNYQATLGIVLIHAGFVIFETIPAAFIANSFGRFIRAQAILGEQLAATAGQVRSSAEEMFTSQTHLAESVKNQIGKMSAAISTIEDISESAQQTTTSARSAEALIKDAAVSTEEGREKVRQIVTGVETLRASNENVRSQITMSFSAIGQIIRMIDDIGRKTEVINEIVFQTKLLSFNASVEAARAGENGKGFAVVAEEVGKLANMSGQAALDINNLLQESVKTANQTLEENKSLVFKLIETNAKEVAQTSSVIESCGETFNEIHQNVARSAELVSAIANANDDQRTGVSKIRTSIDEVQTLSNGNASQIQNSSVAASTLKEQGDLLSVTLEKVLQELNTKAQSAA